ncbi:efflux RND transporter periplasmic adaptor subunit [Mesonia sp. MT50]|uniref:Efflux RND transporter periplasmic adaptor subunit n=1 Tax=Mesonia profundi TaxID=3070998 RepID=A0ABU0ZY02_9FLAO|nr:efflux RND transporter periplasmic adaptor subunit [Mesonia profundi]MDQ7916336.1 efflux RND transporter periplasmic adaptor subunit [Mesonia profundi]
MKKTILTLCIAASLFSCGEKEKSIDDVIDTGEISQIKAKKSELTSKQTKLKAEIEKLNQEIEKLDTVSRSVLVSIEKLQDSVFKHYVEIQGDVETDKNIILYPEFSGVLSKIYIKEGDNVKKGQILAKIDDGGLSSQLAQSETQLALAETTFERQGRLWDQKIGSEIQFLEAKTNFDAMKNSVNQLRAQLAKTTVKAPFSGTIDKVFSDQGEVVSPGANQLFRLVNLDEMYIVAEVPETYLGKIRKGSDVKVVLSSIGKEFEGKVEKVSNYINPNNRSFEIRISVPNSNGAVKPNLIATVKLNDYTATNAITIPQNILQENSKGEKIAYLFESKDGNKGVAEKIIVETGLSYDNKIEVTKGLESGQTIIVEGTRTIRDGQEVKTKQ